MNLAIVFTAVILSANALPATKHWETFKIAHNKTYKNAIEENMRFAIFQANLKRINEHNARYALGQETYTMAVNLFADMTKEEFSKYLNQHVQPEIKMEHHEFPKNLSVPYSIDWREKNAVGRVRYQGGCGSCWAMSAIGAVEGQNAILNGKLVTLSVQQVVDCSKNIYDNDCDGGTVPNAFKYVRDHGIASEADYPYEDKQGTCRASSKKSVLKIKGYKKLEATEEALMNGVGSIGPISVSINAKMLFFYNGGILKDSKCKNLTENLAHSVLVVGYGTEYGEDYWIVKNSWGKSWGEEGYFRLVRNVNNQCGIASNSYYPTL